MDQQNNSFVPGTMLVFLFVAYRGHLFNFNFKVSEDRICQPEGRIYQLRDGPHCQPGDWSCQQGVGLVLAAW